MDGYDIFKEDLARFKKSFDVFYLTNIEGRNQRIVIKGMDGKGVEITPSNFILSIEC